MSPVSAFREPSGIPVSTLPVDVRALAIDMHRYGDRVAARLDDANEWRIMRMRIAEDVWIGWKEINFRA